MIRRPVSIPFIAGQWSLPGGPNPIAARPSFQSPSSRGSGRFYATISLRSTTRRCFNPLHCGAVVASLGPSWGVHLADALGFQSPSLRGSGRFILGCGIVTLIFLLVSIPFIAGQWSLRPRPPNGGCGSGSFNPLHCGAVVASSRLSSASATSCRSFNPLHCGAVVASTYGHSLASTADNSFQSPSLRGSGRFGAGKEDHHMMEDGFQSPSLRGSGRFRAGCCPPATRRHHVSIPFIAGQWSLHPMVGHCPSTNRRTFQSPSLRGSGRFAPARRR